MSFVSAFALLLGMAPAQAATHPPILPNRDVAVRYTLTAPGRADAQYNLEYDAADERARIDDPAHGTFFLADLPAGTAKLVIPALHSVIDAPDLSGLTRQIDDADHARFISLGPGFYAGIGCEKYLVQTANGSATACMTPDGVVLHFAGQDAHGTATVTALSVSYGPNPEADFVQPDGFSDVTLPPGALSALLRQQ